MNYPYSIIKISILFIFNSFLFQFNLLGLIEGKLGKIDAIGTLSAEYDSRVFGVSSESFVGAQNSASPLIAKDELKSEDDFIVRFSPALHFTKKVKWFSFSGTAGIQFVQYIKNEDKSYNQPITTFAIDFDETLSKNKRISNNAKIRFDATFDLGQSVGASVLEQDLTSYTFFDAGFNVRYNHSPKFGIGAGTSYNFKKYQTGSVSERPYQDLSTLPLSLKAFYIYSEKLDFYSDYTLQRSKADKATSPSLANGESHTISFGAQGDYSSKLSGNANLGYSVQNYDSATLSKQDNLVTSVGVNWKLNTKTSFGFDLNRAFSPSAQGFSTFSTMGRASASHRITEKITSGAYFSFGTVSYTYPPSGGAARDSNSLNQYGLGFNLSKQISDRISAGTGYDYSFIDQSTGNYGRHVIRADVTGRF
jgi:hypothetical protein